MTKETIGTEMKLGSRRRRRSETGMAFATTMLVLLLVFSIMLLGAVGTTVSYSGAQSTTSSGLRLSYLSAQSDEALDVAEAGIDYTRLWFNDLSGPPANTSAFAPSLWGATVAGTAPPQATLDYPTSGSSDSHFAVTIYPCSANSGNSLKQYLIESKGVDNSETVILHIYVQESSFAKYALFIDNGSGGYWSSANRYFDGPVHINGGPEQGVIWTPNSNPLFGYTGADSFTVSMSSIPYAENDQSTGPNDDPLTAADWATVSAGGSSSVKSGQSTIAMPSDTYEQEYAALGQTIPNPATSPPSSTPSNFGVNVMSGGGLYINGNVQQMTLSANNNVNQVITLYQMNGTTSVSTVVTLNAQTNTTTVSATSTPLLGSSTTTTTNYSGLGNGVVYVNGNIGGNGVGGLCGTIADNAFTGSVMTHQNALSIVTGSSQNVNIDGSILVNTPRQQETNGSGQPLYRDDNGDTTTSSTNAMPIYVPENQDTGNFLTHAGELGIVTNTVEALDYTYDSTGIIRQSQLNDTECDAAVFTSNTYNMYNSGSRPKGTYLNMGCYLITNGASINATNGNGDITNGPYMSRTYDNRLANSPPPYFPTTGTNYTVLSWQRVATPVQ